MNKPIYIVDYFRDIVQAASVKLTAQLQVYDPLITGIHYHHGHPIEIVEIISELANAPTKLFDRFPLIALFQDFPETIGQAPGFYADGVFHLIIARGTEHNYSAPERYDKNFKPILYPIYFELLEQIRLSRKFEIVTGSDTYPHTKIDRLYWGREGLYGNTANIMNDRVDCIEIKDLRLRIKTQNC